MNALPDHTAFSAHRVVAAGPLDAVLRVLKGLHDRGEDAGVLVFADATGRQVDFDLRGSIDDVLARVTPAPPKRGPGRPRLGVVAREVTLLPRHWEWLGAQPSGVSAALRRLVDAEIKRHPDKARAQRATSATYGVMSSLGGDLPGFEEATRALYAGDGARFRALIAAWPEDLRAYVARLAAPAFPAAD